MKLITVTQQNKANNPKLFGNNAIGTIRRFSQLPNAYVGVQKIDGGYSYRTDLHEQDGFFDEVISTFDDATQYLGELYFDEVNNVFTRPILNYTQLELDNRLEASKETQAETVEMTRKQAGEQATIEIFKKLRRHYQDGFITEIQFNQSQNLLFDALLPMSYGLWGITKTRLDAITPPANQKLLGILNYVKGIVDNYINNN